MRWAGDSFRTEAEVDHEQVRISGEVRHPQAGPPDSLRVRYEFPHETFDYVIRYGYAEMDEPTLRVLADAMAATNPPGVKVRYPEMRELLSATWDFSN